MFCFHGPRVALDAFASLCIRVVLEQEYGGRVHTVWVCAWAYVVMWLRCSGNGVSQAKYLECVVASVPATTSTCTTPHLGRSLCYLLVKPHRLCCCSAPDTAAAQGGAGNEANKRQKGAAVAPPPQERFPDGSMSLEQVEQRFAELKQEVGGPVGERAGKRRVCFLARALCGYLGHVWVLGSDMVVVVWCLCGWSAVRVVVGSVEPPVPFV